MDVAPCYYKWIGRDGYTEKPYNAKKNQCSAFICFGWQASPHGCLITNPPFSWSLVSLFFSGSSASTPTAELHFKAFHLPIDICLHMVRWVDLFVCFLCLVFVRLLLVGIVES